MILVFGQKPDCSRKIAAGIGAILKEQYPNQKVKFIHYMMMNIKFRYPHNLKWSDYPYINEPQYSFNSWKSWKVLELNDNNELIPSTITTKEIEEAKEVIYGGDPYDTSCLYFDIFLNKHIKNSNICVNYLYLNDSLVKENIQYAWKNKNINKLSENISYYINTAKIKQYFDYLFNVNSLGIFGSVLKDLNVDNNKYNLSKYSLQLLYELNKQPKMTEGKVVGLMFNWQGTKKYKKLSHRYATLGSESSIAGIIDNLINMEFLNTSPYNRTREVFISPLGQDFLNLLHKDCCDADLPFRRELWQQQDFKDVHPVIDKYIKTFFGKQKRKMNTDSNK